MHLVQFHHCQGHRTLFHPTTSTVEVDAADFKLYMLKFTVRVGGLFLDIIFSKLFDGISIYLFLEDIGLKIHSTLSLTSRSEASNAL